MPSPEDPATFSLLQQWMQDVLTWVGFGTLTGLCAKAIMPGRDPGGALATLMMGVGGAVIGCGTLSYFSDGARITPISPIGFVAATIGAFIILFFYKMLSGYWFVEGESGGRTRAAQEFNSAPRRRGGRRYHSAAYDD